MGKHTIPIILLVIFLTLTSVNVVSGLNMFSKSIAGLGSLQFTDEIQIDDISFTTTSITLSTRAISDKTVPDKVYQAKLKLDTVEVLTQTFTFSALDVSAGARKIVTFSNPPGLLSCNVIEIEVGG